jgi:hypothetical protein
MWRNLWSRKQKIPPVIASLKKCVMRLDQMSEFVEGDEVFAFQEIEFHVILLTMLRIL